MMSLPFAKLTAEEAAGMIDDGQSVGFSGFTAAGVAKSIPSAVARRALAEHKAAGLPDRSAHGGVNHAFA